VAQIHITDFIHLGIDKGIDFITWEFSQSISFEKILATKRTQGFDVLNLNDDMRINTTELNPDNNQYQDHNQSGLFWNGEGVLYIRITITMAGRKGKSFITSFEQKDYSPKGVYIPPTNVIDLDNLEQYDRNNKLNHKG